MESSKPTQPYEDESASRSLERYTDDELIISLQLLAKDLGRAPTTSEMRNLGEVVPDVATFERRLGGWNNALRMAGLEGLHDLSDETMIRQVAELAARLGYFPTKKEINEDNTTPSYTTLRARFGSLDTLRQLVRSREI